jgi:hypothetical protein
MLGTSTATEGHKLTITELQMTYCTPNNTNSYVGLEVYTNGNNSFQLLHNI